MTPFFSRLRAAFAPRSRSQNQGAADERASWLRVAVRNAETSLQEQRLAANRGAQRSFAAAETPDWVSSWPKTTPEINEDLSRQWLTLVHRSRQLARDNEWAQRWLIQLQDNVLGAVGVRLQMRVAKSTRPGEQDELANRLIESEWARFAARGACEVSGRLSWRELEKLALLSLAKDGELLYRIRRGPRQGPFGVRLQLLPATLLDANLSRDYQGRRVRMGVEIDDEGLPVAYWLVAARSGESPGSTAVIGRHVRLPASEVRHRFIAEEIGQLRGIPWLSVGARRLYMAAKFEEAAAVASTNSAQRLGFFVSPNGEAPPGFADQVVSSVLDAAKAAGKILTPEEIAQVTAAAEKFSTTVPGQFDTIPTGYDFRSYDSPWPNVNANEFVKAQIRGWSAARGASYVSIGNDLADVNYSSARVGILDEREHYAVLQEQLVSWLHADVFSAWLPHAVLINPGLRASRLDAFAAAATWRPRRWQGIDPVKEASAAETELRLGLTSRTRLILERGDDPEEIAGERSADDVLFGPLPDSAPSSGGQDSTADPSAAEDQSPARSGNFVPRLRVAPGG